MRKFAAQILLLLLFTANGSFAQNTLIAGKITGENDRPVAGAIIKAVKGKTVTEATTNNDGLYHTGPLPAGRYRLSINMNNESYKTGEINVLPGNTKLFYDFKVKGNKAILTVDEQDPFMAVAFEKIEANKHIYDFPRLKRSNQTKYEGYILDGTGMRRIPDTSSSGK